MDYLLGLWLVEVPRYAADFCRIILVGTLIDATSGVFYTSIGATGKIRNYQIAISVVFMVHCVITLVFLYFKIPFVWVFFSRLLTRGLFNFCIGVYFVNKYTKLKISFYIRNAVLPIFLITLVPVGFLGICCRFLDIQFCTVFISSVLFEILALSFIIMFGLSRNERSKVLSIVKDRYFKR